VEGPGAKALSADPSDAAAVREAVARLNDAARTAFGEGDPQGALMGLQKAALLARSVSDLGVVGACLVESAEVLAAIGEYQEAERFLGRARDLARDEGLEALKGEVYRGYGSLYKARGRLDEAAVCYDRALERLEYTTDDRALARTLLGLSEVYLRQGRGAPATHVLARAAALKPSPDLGLAVRLHLNLGRVAYASGDLGSATAQYASAAQAARKGGRTFDQEVAALGLAGLHLEAGRLEDALESVKEALALSIVAFAREPVQSVERARFRAMGERLLALDTAALRSAPSARLRRGVNEAVRLHDAHPLVLTGAERPYGSMTLALEPRAETSPTRGSANAATVGPQNLRRLK